MTENKSPYQQLLERIRKAEKAADRPADCITLIGVSKRQNSEKIRAVYKEGLRDFGENYLQEAIPKIKDCADLNINWHFIGHIQSNKTNVIANNFDCVHSVDRLKIAQRLNTQRSPDKGPLNVFIQTNLDEETSKSGIYTYNDAVELAEFCQKAENLNLMGLMSIPAARDNHKEQLEAFRQIAEFSKRIIQKVGMPNNLSMGMSADIEAAIAAGATHVRVGTFLFGQRL